MQGCVEWIIGTSRFSQHRSIVVLAPSESERQKILHLLILHVAESLTRNNALGFGIGGRFSERPSLRQTQDGLTSKFEAHIMSG